MPVSDIFDMSNEYRVVLGYLLLLSSDMDYGRTNQVLQSRYSRTLYKMTTSGEALYMIKCISADLGVCLRVGSYLGIPWTNNQYA